MAKYITGNVNFWPFPTVLVVNKAVYDGLTADQQTALTDAAGGDHQDLDRDLHDTPAEHRRPGPGELRRRVRHLDPGPADRPAERGPSAVGQLAADTQDYVTQIEAEKEALGPPATPPPLPDHQDRGVHAASGLMQQQRPAVITAER